MATTIVKRSDKGAPLTWVEMDQNLENLRGAADTAQADIDAHEAASDPHPVYAQESSLGSAAVADILGTVSQSGGVPTGAIIERGSNANGEYVKFADGTMICTHNSFSVGALNTADGGLYTSSNQSWPYPHVFAASPVLKGGAAGTFAKAWLSLGTEADTGTMLGKFALKSTYSVSTAGTVKLEAIGRWF